MYNITIRYKKGTELYQTDTLSQHYLELSKETPAAEVSQVRSRFEADENLAEIKQLVAEEAIQGALDQS